MTTAQSRESDLLSRREAAEYLGLTAGTLEKWARRGEHGLPFIKVGGSIRYRIADLEEFLEKNRQTGRANTAGR